MRWWSGNVAIAAGLAALLAQSGGVHAHGPADSTDDERADKGSHWGLRRDEFDKAIEGLFPIVAKSLPQVACSVACGAWPRQSHHTNHHCHHHRSRCFLGSSRGAACRGLALSSPPAATR